MSFEFDDPSPSPSPPPPSAPAGPPPLPPPLSHAWGQAVPPAFAPPYVSDAPPSSATNFVAAKFPQADAWNEIEFESAEPAPIVEPKFCGRCGGAWLSGSMLCGCGYSLERPPTTEEISAAADRHRRIEQTIARDQASLKSALWLYFAQLVVCLSLLILGLTNDHDMMPVYFLVGDIAMAAVTMCWVYLRWNEVRPLITARVSPLYFVAAPLLALGTFVIASLIVDSFVLVTDMPEVSYLDDFKREGYGFGWVVLSICVMPAVFEELAFRGVILEALAGFLKRNEAILVSALLFAILHLSVASIPHLCLMGIIFAQLRYLSGSILPGILLHFTHNLLVVLAEHNEFGMIRWLSNMFS
ncbi:MAG: CPBP family intramembrane metalloprotease [Planctomycetales bacterium]|nr:CPBP family intramembrane metalloprotease [Planctomycetales bacterium]